MSPLLALLARLPLSLVHGLGAVLGTLLARLPNTQRHVTETNLRLCFPELDAAARGQLLREALRENLKGMLELGALWRGSAERIDDLVREVEGEGLFRQAREAGRGVILLAPHLGSWEMVNLYASRHGGLTSLYRPARSAAFDRAMKQGRERFGAQLVPTDTQGVRALMQTLKQGGTVMVLPDQDPGMGNGVFVPFFGIQTNTAKLLNRLAAKTGAQVLSAYAERLPRGAGFWLRFAPVDAQVASPEAEVAAAAVNRSVEALVRACPGQYLWSYKRFRMRPPASGEPDPYRREA